MATNRNKNETARRLKQLTTLSILMGLFLYLAVLAYSTPDGVTVTSVENRTKIASNGTFANNNTGGYIYVENLQATFQNEKWKAFVGNVSGSLTLDDAAGFTIFDWTITAISGEVYATRTSGSVNWSGISCANNNVTELENVLMNHSNPGDNITITFNQSHISPAKGFTVADTTFNGGDCTKVLNIYKNDTSGVPEDTFEVVVLYDRPDPDTVLANETFGNVVYAQILEQDAVGYDNSSTYDFELLVPALGNTSSTLNIAYYFYVELS